MASISLPTDRARGIRRPSSLTGFWSWFTTVDHKKIGLMYGVTAFVFFIVGGLEALLIRSQLARPDQTILNAAQYNEIFTMHGLTMIFLFVMPMSAAFFNYLIPLMIGARDVAFPRINAFGFWLFLFGGTFLYSSWFLGGAPNGGWFGYAPNSTTDPSSGMTFYALGLLLTGISSAAGAVNLGVTIINMRAPGMSFFRLPVFVWLGLVTQLLLVFSLPIITVGLFELLFDRRWGTHFFDPTQGGDPILWQHLFWLFGHPEVYILILPAFGIVSSIIPTFARKPLFGYASMVYATASIAILSFTVWAHHMFAVGMPAAAQLFFMFSTMLIAVPTGVKIFNWVATMWKGSLTFETPMLFAIAFVCLFTIGGFSGLVLAIAPVDIQLQDTYSVVAHFHYVLVSGAL
ncbi:MAG: cytochrome c oxidase subunit I, partial [Actinomycetota bacterium]